MILMPDIIQFVYVTPSIFSFAFWEFPMIFMGSFGMLFFIAGAQAGERGIQLTMMLMLGVLTGAIIGYVAGIIPLSLLLIIDVIISFMFWRGNY